MSKGLLFSGHSVVICWVQQLTTAEQHSWHSLSCAPRAHCTDRLSTDIKWTAPIVPQFESRSAADGWRWGVGQTTTLSTIPWSMVRRAATPRNTEGRTWLRIESTLFHLRHIVAHRPSNYRATDEVNCTELRWIKLPDYSLCSWNATELMAFQF